MVYIGIDIGGTQVKLGIITKDGSVQKKASYDVAFDGYDTPIFETVKKKLSGFLKENEISKEQIAGIGVSATGQIDVNYGIVIGAAGHIKNWEGCHIKKELKTIYDVPISVMNDANCVALAEQWIGGAKGIKEAVVLTIGTGVGGGIITNGEILCGSGGGAGELGHFTIRNNGRLCSCGNRGCYEQYASTSALVNMVRREIKKGKIPKDLFKDEIVNGKTIFEAIEKDENLQLCLDRWIGYIADGLVGIIHMFDPKTVLIGGGVSVQRTHLIEPLEKQVKSRIMHEYAKHVTIDAASLGNDAGMIGAVYYCIKHGS